MLSEMACDRPRMGPLIVKQPRPTGHGARGASGKVRTSARSQPAAALSRSRHQLTDSRHAAVLAGSSQCTGIRLISRGLPGHYRAIVVRSGRDTSRDHVTSPCRRRLVKVAVQDSWSNSGRTRGVLRGRNLLQTIARVNPVPGGPWRGRQRCFGQSRRVSITATVRRMGHLPADAAVLVGPGRGCEAGAIATRGPPFRPADPRDSRGLTGSPPGCSQRAQDRQATTRGPVPSVTAAPDPQRSPGRTLGQCATSNSASGGGGMTPATSTGRGQGREIHARGAVRRQN